MNLFSKLLKSLVTNTTNYFDPLKSGTSGFWGTPLAQGLGKIQEGQNFLADKARVDWTSKINTGNKYADFGARTLVGIPESIVNIPSDINRSGRQIGRDIVSGDIKRPKVLISDIAGASMPLLTIGTLGGAGSLAKQAGKQTITSLLKHGAKEGIKYGTGFGALGGLESGREIVDPKDYFENLALNTAIGAGTGAVLGPAVGLAGKAAPKAYEKYKASPLADERGFIRIGDIVDKSKVGKTIKAPEELNYETVKGENLSKEQSLMTLKNRSTSNVALHNKIYNTLSRAGEKSFQGEEARPALGHYIDYLGTKEVESSYKKWLVDPYKPDIASFWSELKYKKDALDNSYGESLVGGISNQEGIVPQTVKEPVRASNQSKLPIETRLKSVEESLAPSELIGNEELPLFMNYGIGELKSIYQDLEKEFTKRGISKPDFVDMIEGKKQVPPQLQDLINLHKTVTDKARSLTERADQIGYVEGGYFPHEDFGITKVLQQIFPSTFIDKLNIGGGFFKQRTGKLTDYSKDYSKVMGDYAEQAILKKYEGNINPTTQAEQAVIENVNKLEPENHFDYVSTLNTSTEKPKIAYKINLIVGKDPIRTANDVFSKIGGEVFDSFITLRDAVKDYPRKQADIQALVDKKDTAGVINYFSDILGYKGESKIAFQRNVMEGIRVGGLERLANELLMYTTKRYPLQQFVETASKYDYTNGRTKQFVNDYIDAKLKQGKLDQTIADTIFNGVNRIFSMAQIGGNIKVALTQGTEITRLFAQNSPEDVFYGIGKAFTDKKGLEQKYGFGKEKTLYQEFEDKNPQIGLPKEIREKVDTVLFGPLQAIENWKNRVYAGAAEAEGIKKGLKGQELRNFVRNSVYEKAHLADEFNTPMFLKNSSLNRMLLQYSQFAIKNTLQIGDKVAQKEYARAVGLLVANTINILAISTVAGIPLNFAIQNLFPAGPGPILTFVPEILDKWGNYQEALAQGNDTTSTRNKLIKDLVGNLVPAGSQINKTTGMAGILQRGYQQSYAENPQYPAPTNPIEIAQGLVFGPNSTKSQQDYYNSPLSKQPMGSKEAEIFKEATPEGRQGIYDALQTQRGANIEKKKTIQNILGGSSVNPKSSSDMVNMPNGEPVSIDSIILKDREESEKKDFITEVLYGKYKDQNAQIKQNLLESQGITDSDIQNYYLSKLKNASVEDRASYIASQKNPDFTSLYKNDVLTTQVAQELERKGLIPDADQLMENLKMTDVYYQRKAVRKLQQSKIKDMIKLQRSQSKKLFDAQLKSSRKIRDILAKGTKSKRPKYKKVALPNPYKRKIV